MKQFKDLVFNPHPVAHSYDGSVHALEFFSNGYGVSVVQGPMFYTRSADEYELAVLRGQSGSWKLTYETPVTDDVVGCLSKDQVTEYMKQVQELPSVLD